MEYPVEMGLGAMIYVPVLVKIGSGIQKLIAGIQRHERHKYARTHGEHGDRISVP
jgi:hypothetical protein